MAARTTLVLAGVIAAIALLAYGLLSKGEGGLAVGDPAPDEQLATLEGDHSGSVRDYRGRWVLVNFWASWCDPCREEAPALERLYRNLGGPRFVVLGINLDDSREDARSFVEEFGLSYPQLRDGDGREHRDAYGMTGFPESFLVDPSGRIAVIRRGPVDDRFLREEITPVLAEAPS